MGDFDLGVSLIVLFGIILVAICIIVTMKHNAQANEKYGDLQRRKLIAHYAADYGETGASANKLPSSQEGYQANRGSLIVPNSFNWLMNNNGTQSEQSGELITAPKIDVSNPLKVISDQAEHFKNLLCNLEDKKYKLKFEDPAIIKNWVENERIANLNNADIDWIKQHIEYYEN